MGAPVAAPHPPSSLTGDVVCSCVVIINQALDLWIKGPGDHVVQCAKARRRVKCTVDLPWHGKLFELNTYWQDVTWAN